MVPLGQNVSTLAVTVPAVVFVTIFLEIVRELVSKAGKDRDVFNKVLDYNFAKLCTSEWERQMSSMWLSNILFACIRITRIMKACNSLNHYSY